MLVWRNREPEKFLTEEVDQGRKPGACPRKIRAKATRTVPQSRLMRPRSGASSSRSGRSKI